MTSVMNAVMNAFSIFFHPCVSILGDSLSSFMSKDLLFTGNSHEGASILRTCHTPDKISCCSLFFADERCF